VIFRPMFASLDGTWFYPGTAGRGCSTHRCRRTMRSMRPSWSDPSPIKGDETHKLRLAIQGLASALREQIS